MSMQKIVFDWGIRCFGREHMYNMQVRSIRLIEEAVELAQTFNVPKDQLHKLVDIVYSREVGKSEQELGGVLVTTAVICEALQTTMHTAMLREVRRCLSKPPEHFAERNKEKLQLGLTGSLNEVISLTDVTGHDTTGHG